MKFTQKQIITTTVADYEINKQKEMHALLQKIASSSVDLKVCYREPKSGYLIEKDRCRLCDLKDDTVSIKIFQNSSSFTAKDVPFENVVSIVIETKQRNLIAGDRTKNKFKFIDIDVNIGDDNN